MRLDDHEHELCRLRICKKKIQKREPLPVFGVRDRNLHTALPLSATSWMDLFRSTNLTIAATQQLCLSALPSSACVLEG